jgi:hypothetical protein
MHYVTIMLHNTHTYVIRQLYCNTAEHCEICSVTKCDIFNDHNFMLNFQQTLNWLMTAKQRFLLFFVLNNIHADQIEVGTCFQITTQNRVFLFDFYFYQTTRFS